MNKSIKWLSTLLLCSTAQLANAWQSCDQWAQFTDNDFSVYNNIWGGGAGTQCVWANSKSNWGVQANHPNSGGIKSYPNVSKEVDFNVSELGECKSSFAVTLPSGGAYSSAYDIWYDDHKFELMLWMNWNGSVSPISYSYNSQGQPEPEARNVSVGGHTWDVYRGTNGYNTVFSFLPTREVTSGNVDITAISSWIRNKGWFNNNDAHLHKIEFGFEITSSAGGKDFMVDDYALSCQKGRAPVTPVEPTNPIEPSNPTTPDANTCTGSGWTYLLCRLREMRNR